MPKFCPLTGKDIFIAFMQNILKPSKISVFSVFGCYGLCGSLFLDSDFDKEQCLKKKKRKNNSEAKST